MEYLIGAVISVSLITLFLIAMRVSWRRRARRDARSGSLDGSSQTGEALLSTRCLYVSTTPVESPLERLAIPGLAFRAWANVSVESRGLRLEPRGEVPTFIPWNRVDGIRPANATIDRSAGPASLTAIAWTDNRGARLESFLRIPSRAQRQQFSEAVASLIPPTYMKESTT